MVTIRVPNILASKVEDEDIVYSLENIRKLRVSEDTEKARYYIKCCRN
ncbi:MAG: hypothetical protein ACRC1P_10965 [Cellulosilyticaceae bacterium]